MVDSENANTKNLVQWQKEKLAIAVGLCTFCVMYVNASCLVVMTTLLDTDIYYTY